jgi:hypothetical protein
LTGEDRDEGEHPSSVPSPARGEGNSGRIAINQAFRILE